MRRKYSILASLVVISSCLVTMNSNAGTTRRISVNNELGIEGDNTSGYPSKVATNGKLAFTSMATNLVANDQNGKGDTFVYDMTDHTITRVSSPAWDGGEGEGGWSDHPHISGDGTTVSFHSQASNLVENDTNQLADIFVRKVDITPMGAMVRANLRDADDTESLYQVGTSNLSGDGTLVVFDSSDPGLVANDINNKCDVFVRNLDPLNKYTKIVSENNDGTEQGNNHSEWPSISANGRYVVFSSRSTNLHPDAITGTEQIFRKDLITGDVALISVATDGTVGNGRSIIPSISDDGKVIAFWSNADNLLGPGGDNNNLADIFVRDLSDPQAPITERVNVHTNGSEANGWSDMWSESLSGDGNFVVFSSQASNLTDDDTPDYEDIFVRDRVQSQTTKITVTNDNPPAPADGNSSFLAAISGDGRYVSFESAAANLDDKVTDNNQAWDVFVHDRYDNDGDGYAAEAFGYDDCDDTPGPIGSAINPGAEEICDDNLDNNCDGLIDDNSCTRKFEICDDGIDNDFDGFEDCLDKDCKHDPICP